MPVEVYVFYEKESEPKIIFVRTNDKGNLHSMRCKPSLLYLELKTNDLGKRDYKKIYGKFNPMKIEKYRTCISLEKFFFHKNGEQLSSIQSHVDELNTFCLDYKYPGRATSVFYYNFENKYVLDKKFNETNMKYIPFSKFKEALKNILGISLDI